MSYVIDLRRLQVLRILDEHGRVTAVAEALHLTPSAVSQQIRQLSREVGVELLHPEGRGVRLTPAARVLLDHADTLYAQWEQALAEVASAETGGGGAPLRLCGFPTALASLLAPAAAQLRDTPAPLETALTEAESAECFELLLAERADIAVVVPTPGNPPPDDRRFDQQALLDDPFDLVVPAHHWLAGQRSVNLADAATEPWIAAPGRIDDQALVLAACAAKGFTPHIAHRAEEWNAIVALVTHGFGVCLMPRLAPIPPHHAVVRLPLRGDPAPSRRVITCVRRGSRGQAMIARGLTALEETSQRLPPLLIPGDAYDDGPEEFRVPHRHTYRG